MSFLLANSQAYIKLETSLDYLFNLTPVIAATIVSMYVLMSIVEYFTPSEKGHSWSGRFRNFTYTLVFLYVGNLLIVWLTGNKLPFQPRLYEHEYPIFYALAYIFVSDFLFYWYHRAQHRWPILWRVHELHHSDSEMNITTSLRTHWLDKLILQCIVTLPTLFILGYDIRALYWWAILGNAWEMFTHANVNFFVHPIATVICNPSIHRMHHSRLPQHHHCNFAQYFTCIDMVFGTYIEPRRDAIPPTGTDSVPSDYSVFMSLIRPFWRKAMPAPAKPSRRAKKPKRRSK